jgi:hypothetical protein
VVSMSFSYLCVSGFKTLSRDWLSYLICTWFSSVIPCKGYEAISFDTSSLLAILRISSNYKPEFNNQITDFLSVIKVHDMKVMCGNSYAYECKMK